MNIENGIARLKGQVIDSSQIDWRKYMKPSDCARVIPAETLAEECKRELLLGSDHQIGLMLPWDKTRGKVLIKPGKLAIWVGWSFHGKSAMTKQVMANAIYSSDVILIASMEEELKEIWIEMMTIFLDGDITPRGIDSFVHFITGKLYLYNQQGVIDGDRINAMIRYAKEKYGITQCLIDSLMLVRVGGNTAKDNAKGKIDFMSDLKSTAADTQVTAHLVCHMRKSMDRKGDTIPGSKHDIHGGQEIFAIADYCFNVWRDQREGINKAILDVQKQRGKINKIGKYHFEFNNDSRKFFDPCTAKGSYHDEF
jgi:twinkle protein